MKKIALAAAACLLSASAMAEPKFYLLGDIGFADADFGDTSFTFDIGGGVKFNDSVELEAAYNDFGDFGRNGFEATSFSLGLNLGGRVSEGTRLYGIIGVEDLEAEVESFGQTFEDSSTEAFYGIGAAIDIDENVVFRPRIVLHDSGDVRTFTLGIAAYF